MLSIIVASIVVSAIGSLWYSPLLFGNVWAKHVFPNKKAVDEVAFKKALMKTLLGNFGMTLALHCVMSFGLPLMGIADALLRGLTISAVNCLMQVGHAAFTGKPLVVYLIDHCQDLTCITVAVIILSLF